jgi:hypothetical protein
MLQRGPADYQHYPLTNIPRYNTAGLTPEGCSPPRQRGICSYNFNKKNINTVFLYKILTFSYSGTCKFKKRSMG